MNKLLSFLIAAWLIAILYMVTQATTANVHQIWVYWDRDSDGFFTPGDSGLGGQPVQLFIFPCDPDDPNCVAGLEVLDGVTGANGQASFEVADGVWGVAGCYLQHGCKMNEGAIEFQVEANGIWLPVVRN